MSVIQASDMKIYEAQFASAMTERIAQNVADINSGMNGTVIMRSSTLPANYEYNSFFTFNGSLVTRQDITATAAVTPTEITQAENIAVKLHRKHVTWAQEKAAKMAGVSFDSIIGSLGEQVADGVIADKLNSALAAVRAAIVTAGSSVLNDITAATVKTVSISGLLDTLRKFGDRHASIAAWVMHSEQYFDLGLASLDDDVTNIADGIVRRVDIPGLGRPIFVTDSASLIKAADTPDSYFVLGLAKGAIDINESEGFSSRLIDVPTLEMMTVESRAEYAYNLSVKGYQWDVNAGAANPDASALATGTNWDKIATSYKDTAGVALQCQRRSDQ
jgi:hypothetical protein